MCRLLVIFVSFWPVASLLAQWLTLTQMLPGNHMTEKLLDITSTEFVDWIPVKPSMEVFLKRPAIMLQVCVAIMLNAFETRLFKTSSLGDIPSVHGAVSTFWSILIQVNQHTKVTMVQRPGTIEFNASDFVHLNSYSKIKISFWNILKLLTNWNFLSNWDSHPSSFRIVNAGTRSAK